MYSSVTTTRLFSATLFLLLTTVALLVPVQAQELKTDDHILLSEAVATPTTSEFIEIANPTASTVDLTNYYLSDDEDYALLPGASGNGPAPSIGASDFIAQFPAAATIPADGVLVIAFDGAAFETDFGFKADFEIHGTDAGTPDMIATDVGATAGLTNSGENLVLFTWDGTSDLVQDVDMINLGTPSATNNIGDKTGVAVDGPDADTATSTYLNDASTMPQQASDPGFGFSTKRIALETGNETTGGGNGLTGDDETTEDIAVTWDGETANPFTAPSPGTAEFLLSAEFVINEVDADTPGTDAAEFIELYDGGVGNTPLDGYVVVLFNGSGDTSYEAFDLDGQTTDANGYFVLGNAAVPNVDLVFAGNTLQNGADAVALYEGDDTDFPNGTAVTDANLIDALVYDTNDGDDSGLIDVLTPGQAQINEDGGTDSSTDSNQRIPNGEGGQRNTSTYTQIPPTPGAANGAPTVSFTTSGGTIDEDGGTFDLTLEILNPDGNEVMVDVAFVAGSSTADGADIDNYTTQTVTFSAGAVSGDTETVTVTITDDGDVESSEDAVFMLENIQTSGAATIGAPDTFTLTINDDDTPLPELVINEIDYDQPSTDNAEFLEIKNTGSTPINLDPFAVELVNGNGGGATVYQTIDLPDVDLGAGEYYVICADAATTINCDLDIISSIQNGDPDAVALVQGSTIIDAVSYEGDTGAPYTEGSGSGLEDSGSAGNDFAGISRFPDGSDTDMNNVDLSARCITPGSENLMASTACEEPIEIILVINEVDADTPGTDAAEFIELYDGGVGNVPLDGYVVVLFNGSDDQSYLPAFDLDGFSTDANGYFVIGNAAVPNVDLVFADNALQNGADAVALFMGDATDFPNDTPVTTTNLLDALVYDTNDGDDSGLLVLLNSGQPQINENENNDSANESNQRIPNGEGGQRNTNTYTQTTPTPGAVNRVEVFAEIFEIQGSGLSSTFDGQFVTTLDNIVTAVGPEGFFIQTPDARDDGDPLTSNGIYVFTNTAPTVAVGDQVDVTGEVDEFFEFTEFTNNPMVTVDNSGNPLPVLITFDATTPSDDPENPSCDGVSGDIDEMNFECFEGMRVEVMNGAVGSGNQSFGSDPIAEVYVVADATRPFREPGIEYPGLASLPVWDSNPEVFELDPDRLGLPNLEIPGGSSYSATGVIGFDFGNYELWPTALSVTEDPLVEPVRPSESNEMTIGTLNVFRLFDDVDDPADGGRDDQVIPTAEYQMRLTKFSQFIREVMLAPDILAVQEAEKLGVLEDLAAEIQADDPTITYTAYLIEGNDIGTIDVGFLVRSTVQVDDVTQLGAAETLTFDGSLLHDRPPLLLEATYTGGSMPKMIAVMNVHNRSLNGIDDPSDGPRVRQKRLEQAQSIAQKVQDFQTANPGIGLAVTGDFNAYEFTDGYVDAVGQIAGDFDPNDNLLSGPDLVNPNLTKLVNTLPAEERYSFVFNGTAQVLDHVLTTQLLTGDVRGLQYGRGNADAPEILIEDDTTPARSSDHDGLVLYVDTSGDPLINEFVADHTGSDTDEFIELFGEPNSDYSTFTVLAVEGDAGGSLGEIDAVFPVGTTDASGFWTTGFLGNALENGTMTLLLVKGFRGSTGDDIDADDDGVIDNSVWALLVDDVAVTDEGAGDLTYSAVVLAPNLDNRNAKVGGASRIPNGLDTDSVGDWARNDFDGEGLPNFPDGGTPKNGEAINTPGTTNQLGVTPPAPEGLVINEVDSNTPGSDTLEFIELFDGGVGNVALDNVVVVLYNGEDDASYRAIDLDGFTTDANGFFVLGNSDVPNVDLVFGNSTIQNGPDAVAIYAGEAADFSNGTGVTTELLVDALVYGPADESDFGLRQLLNTNQPQVDENGLGDSDLHSLQRIPNGSGGARNTDSYVPLKPTPGAINGGADLSLDMTLGVIALDGPNVTGTFLLTLMNDGPSNATGIVVTNPLPDAVALASATPSQGAFDQTTGSWTMGDVANGEAATLLLVLSIDQTITFTNFAEVTAANEADPDSDPADGMGDDAAAAALNRDMPDISGFQADLSLTKTADVGTATEGGEVVFTLIINNAGPVISAGVEVTDLLPSGLTYASDSGEGTYDPSTGIWNVGAVPVSKSDTLRIVTTVNGTGSITNTARITASNLPDPDSSLGNDDSSEDDQSSATVEVQANSEKATSVNATAEIPAVLELSPNYPNPFNPETTIPFGLPEATHVTLRVYDLLGRQVEVLVDGTLSAGRHDIQWDASRYPSGVYLVRVQAGSEIRTQRLTLMK